MCIRDSGTYVGTEHQVAAGALMDRYFLFAPARAGDGQGFDINSIQGLAILTGLAVVAFVVTARLMNAEAGARRMGLFLYVFVAVLLLALFAAAIIQPEFHLFGRQA